VIDRKTKRIEISEEQSRFIVTLLNDTCAQGSMEAGIRQFELLRALVDNPMLGYCGNVLFQTLKMKHTGDRWELELEAITTVPTGLYNKLNKF